MNRTPIVAFLLALMLFQAMGWLLAWCIAEGYARHEAARFLEKPAIPVLDIVCSSEYFKQNRIGRREVRLNGHLYDIKKMENAGDSIRLVLYHDAREEHLFSMLGQLLHPKNAISKEAPAPLVYWLVHWLTLVFLVPAAVCFEQKVVQSDFSANFSYLFWLPAAPASRKFSPPWFQVPSSGICLYK